ncbi:Actin/actin-like protein [Panus rudis PR-1116 ss-1]|nr:Actin/actin-like protein [Panus rudis PR-1116 ss-1]
MVNYGGDEVSALVLDIGSSTTRAGYAGDDTPKAVIPTCFGLQKDTPKDVDVNMGGEENESKPSSSATSARRMFVGNNGPTIWREGMEVAYPYSEGLITDFDAVTALASHAFRDIMRTDTSEHPILVTESAWNTAANRERMAEIMFEEFQVPAFYIANTGVLNAFAAGKGSALVIDIGRDTASVTPVVDGFVLRKGVAHSALPKLVHAHAMHVLTNPTSHRPGIQLLPHQLIANKQPVDPGKPPRFTLRDDRVSGTTDSWRQWYEAREVDEWIQAVAGVLDQGWNEQAALARGVRHYEFPTGYNFYFGAERFQVGEQWFTHSPQLIASNPNLPMSLPALIKTSLQQCDQDLRPVLMGNVVLTGGGSLFAGLSERLSAELTRNFAHAKIHSPGNPAERRYGGWLGGSILASLGNFHQLWISKEEWQEHGKKIVAQRCK